MQVENSPEPGKRVLVVEDEASQRAGLTSLLRAKGYDVAEAENGKDALHKLPELRPDLMVTDLTMPVMGGNELLLRAQEAGFKAPVIVVSGAGDVTRAVQAMKDGAVDYIEKPVNFEALARSIRMACALADEQRTDATIRRSPRLSSQDALPHMLGESAPMRRIYGLGRQVAPSKATVLVTGESGTGKGAFARAVHEISPRKDQPFVEVQATALVDNLLESELFGHERGAFTGAEKRRIGRFEQADGGTLFLDEVGEIPLSTQVKLLRVLQEKRFERVGGNEPITVDVRLICATNKNLAEEVRAGRFREDLFYRLNVVTVEMPPLRARGDDKILLAEAFLKKFARESGKELQGLTPSAKREILERPWPGNVRQLENSIECATVLCNEASIDAEHLPSHEDTVATPTGLGCQSLAELEKKAIIATLEAVNWSTSRAAEILGISVRTVQYRLHQYGLTGKKR